ncbi:MAG: sigma-70 family RNA polymerase sigma factor [Chloroflexota bacterium]|nr:sigma-70 family RNA polymerase sigma factor [Chloroflexota bacterium]
MTRIDSEQVLIQRAKKCDPTAFAEIYDRCQPPIYRYISYRVNNPLDVDDLTSDVFVRLVERIDRFTYRGKPILAWLYTIAHNLVIDYYRRVEREKQSPLDEQLAANTVTPEEYADTALDLKRLSGKLQQLTKDQQNVIIFKFIEGHSNAQVAQLMGKTVGAIKSLQHRGLAALRRAFENDAKGT